ncbi:MAG TPA: glutamate synthase central domain-containing protein, partial [Sedimentisphaerales bacterium]
ITMSGRSLPHAMTILIPEAWGAETGMSPEKRAYYEFHASLMEPWDGPAAVAFTDGRVIGATLDRNGLRPARYLVTYDNFLIMASETGVLDVEPENVKHKGCLEPGNMLLADLTEKRIIPDEEIKARLANRQPYAQWIQDNQVRLDQLPEPPREIGFSPEDLLKRQRAFGYTDEDIRMIIVPMATDAQEPVGSMGADTPLACLSDKPQPLFNYFKQNFAQVTNPPIDSIREELVMSLTSYIGTEGNLLDETPKHCHTLKLPEPILTNRDLEKMRRVSQGDFLATMLPMLFRVDGGEKELERALDGLCRRASLAIKSGYTIIILSDRGVDEEYASIPSLLALTAVHNHLVREKTRTQVALIVESGEPREVMHYCLLLGFGASAVNPYLAIETLEELANREYLPEGITFEKAVYNYKKAVNKGILKTMSKMGISTLQSYQGAQVFEALGLGKELIEKYFTGIASRIGGIGLNEIAMEAKMKHDFAFRKLTSADTELDLGGNYYFRINGERHSVNPTTI